MNITFKNVTKAYGGQIVLKDLTLSLENVHAVGIIGASGCGKSTLLRQLSAIETPEGGEIWMAGQSPTADKAKFQRKIGVVFQRHHLFPHLSLKENIALILRNRQGLSRQEADQHAMELLGQFHLEDVAHKKPAQVSGGQAQRCAIARALSTNPQYLFLDEPTAALDPVLTKEVLQAVSTLKGQGIDFVFVTHELAFLQDFADYVVFMKEGQIWEHGTIDCLAHPKTTELAVFLSHEGVHE